MKNVAKQLAAKGRNGDTMLVHMSPEEVAGLQYLALASGGPLTVNPDTGLVEAFKLKKLFKSILPTILGAVLAPLTGGSSLAIAGLIGAGTGIIKKDWRAGLAAGLGAYGGAGLGKALAAKGVASSGAAGDITKNTLVDQATSASTAIDPTTAASAMKVGGEGSLNTALSKSLGQGIGQIPTSAATSSIVNPYSIAPTVGQHASQMGAGLKALATKGGGAGQFVKDNLGTIGMALGPTLAAAGQATTDQPPEDDPSYYLTNYSYGQMNPNFGAPGEAYFNQAGYSDGRWAEEYPGMPKGAGGGVVAFDEGGLASIAPTTIDSYVRNLNRSVVPNSLIEYLSRPDKPGEELDNEYRASVRNRMNQVLPQSIAHQPYVPPAPPPPVPTPATPAGPTEPGGKPDGPDRTKPKPPVNGQRSDLMDRIRGRAPGAKFNEIIKNRRLQEEEAKWATVPRYAYQPGAGFRQTGGPVVKKATGGGIGSLPESRLLRGPGDGTSDSIRATINDKQPARLADGEYVIDARTVSELGNGSTEAGAAKLRKMVSRVHAARRSAKLGKPSKADKYLPA